MAKERPIAALVLGASLLLGLAALGHQLADAALRVKALERTVVVKGLSEREVPADIAIWPLTFQTAEDDLATLFESLERMNDTVIGFLVAHGLERDTITVAPPAVVDRFAQSHGSRTVKPPRFSGRSTVTVHSTDVAAVRKAMARVIELGKEGIALSEPSYQHPTQFIFTGLSALKPAMVEEATKHARQVAERFAADSQSRLGKIKSARQGQFSISDRDRTTAYLKKVRVVSTVEYYLAD